MNSQCAADKSKKQGCRYLVGIMTMCVVSLGLYACGRSADQSAKQQTLPGATYESIRELPDWSGWWQLTLEEWQKSRSALPMKPEILAAQKAAAGNAGFSTDSAIFCRPIEFVGFNSRFAPNVEFLFTPGRVTITNEMGLLRRIYTDGRSLPVEFDEANMGTSVGHWEGNTLVIETAGINPEARYPGADPGAIAIGNNVKITERITRRDETTLEIVVETVAPDIFSAPDRRTIRYTHSDKRWAQEVINCVDNDRDFDATTGKQRFDLTPPADIAPPPSAQ